MYYWLRKEDVIRGGELDVRERKWDFRGMIELKRW